MISIFALAVTIARQARRLVRRHRLLFQGLTLAFLLCALEALIHVYRHSIPRPSHDLDAPFATQCRDPHLEAASPRENAALVMLARNSERDEARETMRNVEAQFNQWFNYPVVFLNDEPWDEDFVRELEETVSGDAIFEVIPSADWTYPAWVDQERARQSMAQQDRARVWNGGKESYHHMCRFYSGAFYKHPVLAPFKWYWRIEPGVRFTCALTYDPFAAMARNNKVYGYTIALWEEPNTCPSLFREVDNFRAAHDIPKTPSWNAMLDTPAPWYLQLYPVRRLLGLLGAAHTSWTGDRWNLCHYWSNFEIASLDFFRSDSYQALFDHLDRSGGFYHERWGDAPVHSLAVHLLLKPHELHHFSDIGYHHEPFFQCPGNAPGDAQLPGNEALAAAAVGSAGWSPETDGAIGCRCQCLDRRKRNNRAICLERMGRPAAYHRPGWWDRWKGRLPYAIGVPG
ncbi:glycosyltransferase family 15 protein [Chaetomium sp. MPI-SDFR-AT-0129]|nr:glycosyltransferase family 15 protein [Chaetomium sp. MPI-SDFR-AT-0129]